MGGKTNKGHKKRDGSAVPEPREEPVDAEMSWGGSGGGGGGGWLMRAGGVY